MPQNAARDYCTSSLTFKTYKLNMLLKIRIIIKTKNKKVRFNY